MKGKGSPEHTLIMPAPPFARGRQWRPFRFSTLERVSKRHVQLIRNLEWILPNVRASGEVSSSVRKRLHEILDENVSLQAEYVHIVPLPKLRRYVGEPTFLAVLSPQPNKTRGLLEVELGLAHMAIDLLLGGTGEAVALRPLTDLEEGVMTYVIIEMLRALAPAIDPSLPKLRLESVVRGFDEVVSLIGEDENLAVVQLKAVFGSHVGYVRLFIPEVVLAACHPPADASIRRQRRSVDAAAHRGRLAGVTALARVEVGQVEIGSGDLAQLEERDVVLVDALTCRPDLHQGGTALLKVNRGLAGHAVLAVEPAGVGAFKATITGFVVNAAGVGAGVPWDGPSERPPDLADSAESTSPHGHPRGDSVDQSGDGADLMNDIPLSISVELARIPVTAEEVVSLKVGHVFDLNRATGEPLDLSVNGRVVARGELVEVDGNLGVRILSLAG